MDTMRRVLLLVVVASMGLIGVASAGPRRTPRPARATLQRTARHPSSRFAGLQRQMRTILAMAPAVLPRRQSPPKARPAIPPQRVLPPAANGYSCPAGLSSPCPVRPCVRFIGAAGALAPVATAPPPTTMQAVPQSSAHCGGARAPATRRVSLAP
jgi:hypothetical protein